MLPEILQSTQIKIEIAKSLLMNFNQLPLNFDLPLSTATIEGSEVFSSQQRCAQTGSVFVHRQLSPRRTAGRRTFVAGVCT